MVASTKIFVSMLATVAAVSLAAPQALAQHDHRGRGARPFTPAWAGPQLDVSPSSGPPGTRVRISGAKFHENVEVYYGDVPMQILRVGGRDIDAVIPPDVRGDHFIYVIDNTGRARTSYRFDLQRGPYRRPYERRYEHERPYNRPEAEPRYQPQPEPWGAERSLEVMPPYGQPGSQVLIRGRFAEDAAVYYGRVPMRVLRRGPNYIVAEIPPFADRDRHIRVVDRYGTARTDYRYGIVTFRRWR